jgi:6-pyruvoyltetrahydropterin/6-carboxytetrahydropterin synthase
MPPRVSLTRVYHFSAGHQLESGALTPEQNAALYGPCYRPHGHNYYLEVTVSGVPDPVTGMAADLGAIDAAVAAAVLDRVDHQHLDETVPELDGVITTGENLARAFWGMLRPVVAALSRVAVVETAKNRFEYAEGGETPA